MQEQSQTTPSGDRILPDGLRGLDAADGGFRFPHQWHAANPYNCTSRSTIEAFRDYWTKGVRFCPNIAGGNNVWNDGHVSWDQYDGITRQWAFKDREGVCRFGWWTNPWTYVTSSRALSTKEADCP
jgi:hypothetical protein